MKPYLFDYKEWDVTGEHGLLPLFQQVADPTMGAGVAHDIIEHFHRGHQPCVDELMALGAIYHTRFYAGCATRDARRYGWNRSYEADTASDLRAVFECHQASLNEFRKDDLPEPPKTKPLSFARRGVDVFDDAVTSGMDRFRLEMNRDNDGQDELIHAIEGWGDEDDVHAKMAGWLRYGYQQAQRRWNNKPVCSLFSALEDGADQVLRSIEDFKDIGARVAISFSLPRRKAFFKVMPHGLVPDDERMLWDEHSLVKSF